MKKVGLRMKKEAHKSIKGKIKQLYSLRELIPEITGATTKDDNFDAEYQAVKRIVRAMKEITGNNEKAKKIPQEEKESFVIITRNLYNLIKNDQSGQGHDLFTRMHAKEELTEKEYGKLISFFKEGFEANPELPLYKLLLERVNSEGRFYQLQEEIEQVVRKDIGLLTDLESYAQREQRAKEYLSSLQNSTFLEEWRANVHSDLKAELFKKKMIAIANEKGMDVQKVLEGNDYNLLEEVTSEMIKRDVEVYLKSMGETDS